MRVDVKPAEIVLFSRLPDEHQSPAGSAAGDRTDDQERLLAGHDRVRKRRVWRSIRPVLLAREEPQHRPAPLRRGVSNRPAQRWVVAFQRVEDRPLRDRRGDFQLDHAADSGQRLKIRRQDDVYHASVWTSTESTAGRSRTMGAQVSPAFADA